MPTNSAAIYMLSAIVQKLTGNTLFAYLTPRLLAPLGIDGATWESCPRGVNVGGWGLSVRTEDIACFGQMYLQRASPAVLMMTGCTINWQRTQRSTGEIAAAGRAAPQ